MGVAIGKIILFGEHAVVYGFPGIAIPVKDVHIKVNMEHADSFSYITDRDLYKQEKSRLDELLDFIFLNLNIPKKDIRVFIESTIPIAAGLGSSAALSVALIRAVSKYFKLALDDERINKLAFECEKFFHGTPSGIDNTVITYEKPVYFQRGDIEFINLNKPIKLVIANTGIKADTKQVVSEVRERYMVNKEKYSKIFDEIGKITVSARASLEEGDLKKIGDLMSKNHMLLKELEVSSSQLDKLVKIAITAGAYGAKISRCWERR